MKKFRSFRNKKKHLSSKYILLILTGVCIVALFTSLVFNLSGGPLNSVAGYVFVPMQKGINNAGSWISGKANDFQTLGEVLKENKKLQNQVDDLTNQLNVTKLEQYELDNYRELLDLDDKYSGYQKVAANVIAMDGTNWFSSFTIDKGSKEGIKKGMNVIAGSGLVGIVTDVGPNFAKVRSIIDDSSNVSSMVLTTKDNFNVGGSLKSMNQDKVLPFTELRDEDDKVKVGESGCGKSTIAGILAAKNRGYTGRITLGGVPLSEVAETDLMKHVVLVRHNSYLFKGNVEENLRMAKPDATKEEMEAVLQKVNLLGFLQTQNGLQTELLEKAGNLSGGQCQRLVIARALLRSDSAVYIFDEAASNIDVESEEMIMNVIHELAKTKTVLLISHRLANVVQSDQIYFLKNGTICERGTHAELMEQNGAYRHLYDSQMVLENYGKQGNA